MARANLDLLRSASKPDSETVTSLAITAALRGVARRANAEHKKPRVASNAYSFAMTWTGCGYTEKKRDARRSLRNRRLRGAGLAVGISRPSQIM